MTAIEGYGVVWSSREDAEPEVDIGTLVATYSTVLFRVAHSILRSRIEAEDVVQDVFVRVLEHRHGLPAVREMRVWLIRIAWRLAVDRRRKIRPQQMDAEFVRGLVATGIPADRVMEEAQRVSAVLNAMEELPAMERNVLLLSAIEELRTAEIAEVLGKSESAVRAVLFRARSRLKERLERGGGR